MTRCRFPGPLVHVTGHSSVVLLEVLQKERAERDLRAVDAVRPASAVMRSVTASRYTGRRMCCHQRRIDRTAKVAMS